MPEVKPEYESNIKGITKRWLGSDQAVIAAPTTP